MQSVLEDVRRFARATGRYIGTTPNFLPWDQEQARVDLITEEYRELLEALKDGDIVEAADAIADLIYVAVFLAIGMGIPLDKVWREVQDSNMAKLDQNGNAIIDPSTGKVMKPEGWQPPNIKKVLIDAGWRPPTQEEL